MAREDEGCDVAKEGGVMSHFYGRLIGSAKNPATCRGHRGIEGYIAGWNSGVHVRGEIDGEGKDVFRIYRTGGSNGSLSETLIATVKEEG
jgi:hypothetical protein